MGIVADVIGTLTEKTAELKEYNEEIEKQQAAVKRGTLNRHGVEICQAAIMEAQKKMDAVGERATQAVNVLLENYIAEQAKLDVLNPDELTDDAKLFNVGVKLTEKQVGELLDKNNDNRTMAQLILQYAKENNMKIAANYVTAESKARETAQRIQYITKLYVEHWISHKNAMEMLHKLFQV